MEIRKANEKDVLGIVEQVKELTSHFGYGEWIFKYKDNVELIWQDFILSKIQSDKSEVLVAIDDHQIIGHIAFGIENLWEVYKYDKEVCLYTFFVDDKFRKHGIGKKLIQNAENWAKEKGILVFSTWVSTDNPNAFERYTHYGFKEHHRKMSKIL